MYNHKLWTSNGVNCSKTTSLENLRDISLDNFNYDCLTDISSLDDEVGICLKRATLLLMDRNDYQDDFCICRRCRSLSASLMTPSSFSYVSSQEHHGSSFSKINRTGSIPPDSQEFSTNESKQFGSEEPEINDHSDTDDVPLLLNDSYVCDHCHIQKTSTEGAKKAQKKLLISSVLCLIFMITEIVGGYLSNSLAIMTDAAHLLSDLASFLISLFAIWFGQKAPTRHMSFGYYRAEVLGAVISVLLIWVLTGILVYMAVDRIRFPDYDIDSDFMLIVSGAGVAMNIIMGAVLHGPSGGHHGHSHGAGKSASLENEVQSSSQNINVRAAFIHVLGDLFQSVGVLIAAYVIHYMPQYKIADPICTFIFSALVALTTLTIMRDAIHVLMEGFPRELNYVAIKSALLSLGNVKSVHSLHIWSLTIDKNALSVHVAIESEADPHMVLQTAQSLIRQKYAIYHTTIQVEKYEPEAMITCKTCQGPPV